MGTTTSSTQTFLNGLPDTTSLDNLTRSAYEFGPFFFAILFIILAYFNIERQQRRWIEVVSVFCGILFSLVAVYFWVFPPNLANIYFVEANISENEIKTSDVLGSEDFDSTAYLRPRIDNMSDLYIKFPTGISGQEGDRNFTFQIAAVSHNTFKIDDKFYLELYLNSNNQKLAQTLTFPYTGEKIGKFSIKPCTDYEKCGEGLGLLVKHIARSSPEMKPASLRSFGVLAKAWADRTQPVEHTNATISSDNTDLEKLYDNIPKDLVIVYFKRPLDDDKIINILGNIPTPNRYITETKLSSSTETNAIWVGADVPEEYAENLAMILIRKGVKIQLIGKFENKDLKRNRIEIGHSARSVNNPIVYFEQLIMNKDIFLK